MNWRDANNRRIEETKRVNNQRNAALAAGQAGRNGSPVSGMPRADLAEVIVIAPRRKSTSRAEVVRENGRAALKGAVDEFTFGAADHVAAAGKALIGGDPRKLVSRYKQNIAREHARDAYDAEHYGTARTAGKVAGAGAGLLLFGGVPAATRAAASRVPQLARLAANVAKTPVLRVGVDPRGLATLAGGAGGTAGVVGQAVSDVAHHELSSFGDYAGAGLGGIVDGVVTGRRGALPGAAAGGAATSIAQDVFNGRDISWDRATAAAHAGGALGQVANVAGTYRVAALSNAAKGKLGEGLSYAKSVARGVVPKRVDRPGVILEGYKTPTGRQARSLPDFETLDGYLEAKFGPEADLTANQRILRGQLPPGKFLVDAWQYGHVGKAAGLGSSSFVAPEFMERER